MNDLYDHDLERNVLSIISNVSALDVAKAREGLESSGLRKESFHLEPHQAIFNAVGSVLRKGFPVDPFTVESELKKLESFVGNDRQFITEVLIAQPHLSDSSLPAYSKALNELAVRRNLITILGDARSKAADLTVDPSELLTDVAVQLTGIDSGSTKIVPMTELMGDIAQHLDKVQEGEIEAIIPTGIGPLDHVIGGLQPTLIIVGALPGVGKSALVSTFARNLARDGKRVGIISLEDEATWLPWRILSREAAVEQFVLRFRKLSNFQRECATEGYTAMDRYAPNIFMADGSSSPMGIRKVVQTGREMIVRHKVKALIIDHAGEVEKGGTHGERFDLEVSSHLSAMRSIANQYGVPVVVLMHLKRRQGLTVGTKPTLDDFADSSGAERKARVALGLSRPEGGDVMQIHILKNTNGKGVGMSVEVPFHGASAMLEEAQAVPVEVRKPVPVPEEKPLVQDKLPWDEV